MVQVTVAGRWFKASYLCIDLGTDHMIGYKKPVTGCVQRWPDGTYVMSAAGKTLPEAIAKTEDFLRKWVAWRLAEGMPLGSFATEVED